MSAFQTLSKRDLILIGDPWGVVVSCAESDIDNFVGYLGVEPPKGVLRILRGRNCRNRAALFNEWAAALQFPWYFGRNMDAFQECLEDLDDWQDGNYYAIFVTTSDEVLMESENDFKVLIEVLQSVTKGWQKDWDEVSGGPRSKKPFKIVFQCQHENTDFFLTRLRSGGYDLPLRSLGNIPE